VSLAREIREAGVSSMEALYMGERNLGSCRVVDLVFRLRLLHSLLPENEI
jgi:hypothetical protein